MVAVRFRCAGSCSPVCGPPGVGQWVPYPALGGGLGLWLMMGLRALLMTLSLALRPGGPGLAGHRLATCTHSGLEPPLKWLKSPRQSPSTINLGSKEGKMERSVFCRFI